MSAEFQPVRMTIARSLTQMSAKLIWLLASPKFGSWLAMMK